MTEVTIEGTCDARFERVREAFADNFEVPRDRSLSRARRSTAASSSTCGADGPTRRGRGRGRATRLSMSISATKGLTAICAHRLAGEGRLDLDAPVAQLLARVCREAVKTQSPSARC